MNAQNDFIHIAKIMSHYVDLSSLPLDTYINFVVANTYPLLYNILKNFCFSYSAHMV